MAIVTKIVINVGDKVIELTPDEAKSLKIILEEMYGGGGHILVPYPVYPYPTPWYERPHWQITWTSNHTIADSGTVTLSSVSS